MFLGRTRPRFSIFSYLRPKRCVPKTLAFAFGLRLHSKTRCFKTRVLGRRLPSGKPQERLRFRALRSKTLAFKKCIAISLCDLKTSLGARACVQVLCVQKTRRFAFAFLSPLSRKPLSSTQAGSQFWALPGESVSAELSLPTFGIPPALGTSAFEEPFFGIPA